MNTLSGLRHSTLLWSMGFVRGDDRSFDAFPTSIVHAQGQPRRTRIPSSRNGSRNERADPHPARRLADTSRRKGVFEFSYRRSRLGFPDHRASTFKI